MIDASVMAHGAVCAMISTQHVPVVCRVVLHIPIMMSWTASNFGLLLWVACIHHVASTSLHVHLCPAARIQATTSVEGCCAAERYAAATHLAVCTVKQS